MYGIKIQTRCNTDIGRLRKTYVFPQHSHMATTEWARQLKRGKRAALANKLCLGYGYS